MLGYFHASKLELSLLSLLLINQPCYLCSALVDAKIHFTLRNAVYVVALTELSSENVSMVIIKSG